MKEATGPDELSRKIDLILGRKKVKDRNDYMRIYGIGLNGKKVSRSQNPRKKRRLKLDPIRSVVQGSKVPG